MKPHIVTKAFQKLVTFDKIINERQTITTEIINKMDPISDAKLRGITIRLQGLTQSEHNEVLRIFYGATRKYVYHHAKE